MSGPNKIVEYIATTEDRLGYSNYGMTQAGFNINGTKTVTPQASNLTEAIQNYKTYVLRDELTKIINSGDSDYEALGVILANIQVNQYDYGGTFASVIDPNYSRFDRDRTYTDNGEHSSYKAGNLDYLKTIPYQHFTTNQSNYLATYKSDPVKYLGELTEQRLVMYSRATSNEDTLAEWYTRAIADHHYALAVQKDGAVNVDYNLYINNAEYQKAGAVLAHDVLEATKGSALKNRNMVSQAEYDQWNSLIQPFFDDALSLKNISRYNQLPSQSYPSNQPSSNPNIPKKEENDIFAGLGNLFKGDGKGKSALDLIFGKAEGGGMYRLLTGFTNLLANLGEMLFPKSEEQKQQIFENHVEESMAEDIAAISVIAADEVLGENKDLTPEQKTAMDAAWKEGIKLGESLKGKYIEDGKYTLAEQREFENLVREHFNNKLNDVRSLS